jgi:hypothetical protein
LRSKREEVALAAETAALDHLLLIAVLPVVAFLGGRAYREN